MSDANNLKEKYPDVVTLEALKQILHVSKRRCAWMLANGIIPCSNTGKKTRQVGKRGNMKDVLRNY